MINAYYLINEKYFAVIANQPDFKELITKLGDPDEMLNGEKKLLQRGWETPKYIPKDTHVILIYDLFTGRRFYIFVDESVQIVGHFSSSS